jgi:hypothetical protein
MPGEPDSPGLGLDCKYRKPLGLTPRGFLIGSSNEQAPSVLQKLATNDPSDAELQTNDSLRNQAGSAGRES